MAALNEEILRIQREKRAAGQLEVGDVHAFARAVAAFRAATQARGDAHPTKAALSARGR